MAVTWTDEQRQVIELRGCNLLVSAAAGSGKTAVLVERILRRIGDPADPMDIDELLVVTFTRAAAGEMRERIGRALEKALEQRPDDEHLQRQQTLLHHARISTIHGFCSYVIQNYFQMIRLDPAYRMGDEGEMRLLRADVVQKVLEEAYASEDPDFLRFVECYAPGRTDEGIEELILRLYEFASSYPWPEEWLDGCLEAYAVTDEEQLEACPWMEWLLEEARQNLADLLEECRESIRIAQTPGGPYLYEPMLREDAEQIRAVLEEKSYRGTARRLAKIQFSALSRKKAPETDSALREQVKSRRDACKKAVKELRERYFSADAQEILASLAACRGSAEALVKLVKEFAARFAEEKRKKNLLDFSDLEHFALQILVEKGDDGQPRPTEAAREIAGQFREIMIDEYQDSSFIQEALLSAVSGEADGRRNRFMVGDIKQSIYGFRLARPELFLEKYHAYSQKDGPDRRIDLSRNFRSRREVLAAANAVFRQLMCEAMGGIRYDQAAELYPGAEFPKGGEPDDFCAELLLLDREAPEFEDDRSRETMMEAEAAAAASRIRELMETGRVADRENGGLRPVRFGDIVILLRTVSGWAEVFSRVLQAEGIPTYTASRTGYFSAQEVETVLNYLHICDNPRQEIPFAAVLRSPIVGCTDEELAAIRCIDRKAKFYEACVRYAREGEREDLKNRLTAFLAQLSSFRDRAPYTPIHELITQILSETGFLWYASAMPGGTQRRGNLDMLVEKAVEFESTSYRGLFNFIRYIEQLQRYEVDFGEVSVFGENADVVQIMSVHKSKGLEFPVVILAGAGKSFNQSDSRAALALHSRFGIGLDEIDPVRRTKAPALLAQTIRRAVQTENLAEELRVLYVALTRAKEKLILTGTAPRLERKVRELSALVERDGELLPYRMIAGAGSYLDWLLAAFARSECFAPLYERYDLPEAAARVSGRRTAPVRIRIVEPQALVEEELLRQMDREVQAARIAHLAQEPVGDARLAGMIRERFSYVYPYEKYREVPVKMTVSQLKKAGTEASETGRELYPEEEIVPLIPAFIRQEEPGRMSGADRGTAYHRLLECMDFERSGSVRGLRAQLDELLLAGRIKKEEAECIYLQAVAGFVKSPLGRRMTRAARAGALHREQPFVLAVPAREADPSYPEEEQILVQGIIDAWFEEPDGLVVVDYKTDRVREGEEETLVNRYRLQLMYYRRALERLTGKPVREMNLYAFGLGKNLPIPL